MGVSSGSGTVYHSNVHEFTSGFQWGLCAVLLVFCVMFSEQWFVVVCFFCHCIIYSSIYGFWLLVLLSSNNACRGLLEWTFTQTMQILSKWFKKKKTNFIFTIDPIYHPMKMLRAAFILRAIRLAEQNCIAVFIISLYIHDIYFRSSVLSHNMVI